MSPASSAHLPTRFAGRTAVVTGGGSGIGQAIAVRLACEGAEVVVLELREDGAAETLGFQPPQYLRPGDVVELGITSLGTQRQRVSAEP